MLWNSTLYISTRYQSTSWQPSAKEAIKTMEIAIFFLKKLDLTLIMVPLNDKTWLLNKNHPWSSPFPFMNGLNQQPILHPYLKCNCKLLLQCVKFELVPDYLLFIRKYWDKPLWPATATTHNSSGYNDHTNWSRNVQSLKFCKFLSLIINLNLFIFHSTDPRLCHQQVWPGDHGSEEQWPLMLWLAPAPSVTSRALTYISSTWT